MRIVKTKSDDFGFAHFDIWLDPDDFQVLKNRKHLTTECISIQASKAAAWISVSVTIKLQKNVRPEQKLF